MTYQMTKKQILSGIAEAKADIKEAGNYYRLGLQMHGIKDTSIKHYLRERGKHLVDWQKLLSEADREDERAELWQPGDEPYEPDYWGAHYE